MSTAGNLGINPGFRNIEVWADRDDGDALEIVLYMFYGKQRQSKAGELKSSNM